MADEDALFTYPTVISAPHSMEALETANPKAPYFDWNGYSCHARVASVYDGDTIKIVCPHPLDASGALYRWRVRLYGIDTPEVRTRDAEEKERGIAAREYLKTLILGKVCVVQFFKHDKYGRLLASVWLPSGECANRLVLQDTEGTYAYYGGTKRLAQ